jgi:predicted ATPase
VTRSADDTARQVLAAAAVLGCRFDWRPLAAMVESEKEAVVVALKLPLDTVVGHVLHLPTRV